MSNARYIGEVAPTLGRKNLLINGNFLVWQRGSPITVTAGNPAYTADRWVFYCTGATMYPYLNSTWNSAGTSRALLVNSQAGNTLSNFVQRIEAGNAKRVAGKTITVSGYIHSGDSRNVTVNLGYANAVDNFSSWTSFSSTVVPVVSGENAFSITLTADANCTNGLVLQFGFGALTTGNGWGLSAIQLELGDTATEFEYRSYGEELTLCQRYYEYGSEPMWYTNWGASGRTEAFGSVQFQVAKRTNATVTMRTQWTYYNSGTPTNCTPTFYGRTFDLYWTATGLTNWCGWTGAGTWAADAEL